MNNDNLVPICLSPLGKVLVTAGGLAVVSLILGFGWGFVAAYTVTVFASVFYLWKLLRNHLERGPYWAHQRN